MMFDVTEVEIVLIKPHNGLVGFAAVVINDAFRVDYIGIHKKRDAEGYRLTFPTKQRGEGFSHVFNPIRRHASDALEAAIFNKLNDVMKEVNAANVGYRCTVS